MSAPERAEARAPHPGLTTPTSRHQQRDQGHDSRAVRVWAAYWPPSGRRGLGVLLVESCPWCPGGGAHMHRGSGGPRRAGCGRGIYIVVPHPSLIRGRVVA